MRRESHCWWLRYSEAIAVKRASLTPRFWASAWAALSELGWLEYSTATPDTQWQSGTSQIGRPNQRRDIALFAFSPSFLSFYARTTQGRTLLVRAHCTVTENREASNTSSWNAMAFSETYVVSPVFVRTSVRTTPVAEKKRRWVWTPAPPRSASK